MTTKHTWEPDNLMKTFSGAPGVRQGFDENHSQTSAEGARDFPQNLIRFLSNVFGKLIRVNRETNLKVPDPALHDFGPVVIPAANAPLQLNSASHT